MRPNPLAALPTPNLHRHPDLLLAVLVTAIIATLIVPLPNFALDILLSVNIGTGFLLLLSALFAKNALDLATFPSLLLLTTLFRLALNISTTRGILAHGDAGTVVKSFGAFVLQGDMVVGLVIFLIITLVQLLVVAKGSERVAEVAARFTLDALPGKQMSIDAALRAGAITDEQAQDKRDELSRESQLFGAMDGAMKFVKGDALVGVLIVAINLAGGFAIGVLRFELTAAEAAERYAILSVGDALVAQLPALLVTLAAGILVTRVAARNKAEDLGGSLRSELFAKPKALFLAGAVNGVIALVPGLPGAPFFVVAVLFGLAGVLAAARGGAAYAARTVRGAHPRSRRAHRAGAADMDGAHTSFGATAVAGRGENSGPTVPPIGIDLDPALTRALGLDDGDDEGDRDRDRRWHSPHDRRRDDDRTPDRAREHAQSRERDRNTAGDRDDGARGHEGDDEARGHRLGADLITTLLPQLRDALYLETGVHFPPVRVRSMVPDLSKGTFVVRLKDVPVHEDTLPIHELLAIETPERLRRLDVDARETKHPITGTRVASIRPEDRTVVEAAGVQLWDTAGVLTLHLARILRRNAKTFVGLEEVGARVDELAEVCPTLVREVVPKIVGLPQLVDVLRRLVDEEVSIRDLKTILEAIGEHGAVEHDALALTEHARAALGRQLAHTYAGRSKQLPVLLLDPPTEDAVRGAIQETRRGYCLALDPLICRAIVRSIETWLRPAIDAGGRPVILTNAEIRRFVRKLIEAELGSIPVLSFEELPDDLHVRPIGRVTLQELDAA